jgi:hypothetical protein
MQGKQEFVDHFSSKGIYKKKKHTKVAPVILETPDVTEEVQKIKEEFNK